MNLAPLFGAISGFLLAKVWGQRRRGVALSAFDPFQPVASVSFAEAHLPGVTAGAWQCEWAQCMRCVPPDNHRMHLTRVALGFGPR